MQLDPSKGTPTMKPAILKKETRIRYLGFRLTEDQHARVSSVAEQQEIKPGEWCRAVVLEAARKKEDLVSFFEQRLLEELAGLRSIVSSVIYDLATGSSPSVERMNEIIAHADQTKFEHAAQIISQLLKRQPDTRHE
jgi:hypothetical protein